jgi:hypothetical protein
MAGSTDYLKKKESLQLSSLIPLDHNVLGTPRGLGPVGLRQRKKD